MTETIKLNETIKIINNGSKIFKTVAAWNKYYFDFKNMYKILHLV